MSKRSEGPWFVWGGTELIIKSKNRVIACASQERGDDWETAKANARLLAAAPELLEALVEIMDRSEDVLQEFLCEFEIIAARQAIAKAKGEAVEYLSQDEQEPVAWASPNVIPLRGLKDNHSCILTAFKCEANTVALYTAPPKRKPLSDQDVKKLIDTKHFDPSYEKGFMDEVCLNWYELGLRDGEKAHGIGVENETAT